MLVDGEGVGQVLLQSDRTGRRIDESGGTVRAYTYGSLSPVLISVLFSPLSFERNTPFGSPQCRFLMKVRIRRSKSQGDAIMILALHPQQSVCMNSQIGHVDYSR